MVQSVLGSLILGYRPLWNRARKLAAIQLYVHSEASALVDTAHLLRTLQEELEVAMALTGCRTLADISPEVLWPE